MTSRAGEILRKMQDLELELEHELAEKRLEWHYRLEANRIRFEQDIREYHRRLKRSVPRFIREGSVRNLLTSPIIHSVFLPLVVLDLWFTVYQAICFPIYKIPTVSRRRYFVIDRQYLAYLNGIEKLNCVYCSYANGVIAYVREIAGRTEQYWCPIKHARRVVTPHQRYRLFIDYGDAEGYHKELPRLPDEYHDVRDEE